MGGKETFFQGYIEGYFGRELSWEQRYGIVEHLASLEMNCYLYAPKEDPYHRLTWKEPYPEDWCEKFRGLYEYGQQKRVRVLPALAPGLSYNYVSEQDYQLLLEKFRLYFSLDVSHIALFMDDIALTLPEESQNAFNSLGEAHGKLLARLLTDLRAERSDVVFWFCPTIYSDQFVEGKAVDSDYINDLHSTMPAEITLMWTGDRIIARTIEEENCGDISSLFGGNIIFWDNLYANDYAPLRLFLGNFEGRPRDFLAGNRGIMINPTGLYHTDRFLLSLFGRYMVTGDSSREGWCCVAEEYGLPEQFVRVSSFFWLPYTPICDDDISPENIEAYGDLYNDLIVPWVHPLKLEWFTWLQGLYLDLVYLSQNKEGSSGWIQQRYPMVIAKKMGA